MKHKWVKLFICAAAVFLLAGCGSNPLQKALRKLPWFQPSDGPGMEAELYAVLTVIPVNSGTDEFGESVGYGEGTPQTFEVHDGDAFFEDFGDKLVQNPSEKEQEDLLGSDPWFTVVSVKADSVVIQDSKGEERELTSEDTFSFPSCLEVLDGASTSYTISFEPMVRDANR